MKNRKNNKKGFTIVELVIVIGVIGILSAILIPTFVSLTSKADQAALKSNCANAYSMYAAVAADRKVDASEFSDAAENEAIVFATQEKVELSKGGETFVYTVEDGWKSGSLTSPTLVGVSEAHSTFNGYVVKYIA